MNDPLFLAWAAGFFDGEGCVLVEMAKEDRCIHKVRTSLHATVTQTSLPCLEKYLDVFGGGITSAEHRTPNGRRWAVQYRWSVRNEKAIEFLKAIQPYSVVKASQIEVALKYPMYSADGRKYGNKTNPIPDAVMQARLGLRKMLQDIRADMKTPAKPPKVLHG